MYTRLGADPEFFFKNTKTGNVVGSEFVIPKKSGDDYNNLIQDGVAGEINPHSETCRENLWRNIVHLMNQAQELAGETGHEVIFDTTVNLKEEEFNRLSPMNREFGCVPSENAYGKNPIPEGASNLLQRSAGGHIHIDYKTGSSTENLFAQQTDINRIVKVLDVIAGNTCVLFDQYPGSKERRVTYGRAGEYREKSYGLEYRTLSNFWLRDYRLFGLATGLVRQALWTVGYGYAGKILESVNQDDIVKAINENDFNLAFDNFKKYAPILVGLKVGKWGYPIDEETIDGLFTVVQDGGIYTDKTPYEVFDTDWIGNGFEDYLTYHV